MAGKHQFRPGQKASVSGQYKNNATGSEVTVVKGEPFPPASKPNQSYSLALKTKHKGN
jgi:hypothetical protein